MICMYVHTKWVTWILRLIYLLDWSVLWNYVVYSSCLISCALLKNTDKCPLYTLTIKSILSSLTLMKSLTRIWTTTGTRSRKRTCQVVNQGGSVDSEFTNWIYCQRTYSFSITSNIHKSKTNRNWLSTKNTISFIIITYILLKAKYRWLINSSLFLWNFEAYEHETRHKYSL